MHDLHFTTEDKSGGESIASHLGLNIDVEG